MTGEILGGRYSILDTIGEGGMAIVYRAKDTLLNRVVAIKVLRPQYASDSEFRERFRREAPERGRLCLTLTSVNVYDVGGEEFWFELPLLWSGWTVRLSMTLSSRDGRAYCRCARLTTVCRFWMRWNMRIAAA